MNECTDPSHIPHSGSRWHRTTQPLEDYAGRPYHDKKGNPIIYRAVYPCPVVAERERLFREDSARADEESRREEWWKK